MNWLKGVATALIITLLTTLLLAAFQRPISEFFAPDRLHATMEVGPWFPLLNEASQKRIPETLGVSDIEANEFMGEDYGIVRFTVENNSSKPITEIRLRHKGISDPYVVISESDKPTYKFLGQVATVSVPDLKPGQAAKIYMWRLGGFGWPTYDDHFQTFSSEGPWRMDVRGPRTVAEELQLSPLEEFLFNWGEEIIAFCLFGLFISTAVAYVLYGIYTRDLLSDADFYEAERIRYDDDPDKFKVKWKGLGDFAVKHAMDRRKVKRPSSSAEEPQSTG